MDCAAFNPLEHPVCLREPARRAESHWYGHVPFAMAVVDLLRPRTLVELGTYTGVSYCAFCQAVAELKTRTRCTAVDTWDGDAQTGGYGPEVLDDLRRHHDPLYGAFSRLHRTTFDSAAAETPDGSVDLLHVDGLHTYDAVRRDLDAWLPKMSPAGVVLLHDIAVVEPPRPGIPEFGVHRLWAELRTRHPMFEFRHCWGLGVAAVGGAPPAGLRPFFEADPATADRLRALFAALGGRLEASLEFRRARDEAVGRLRQLEALSTEHASTVLELSRLRAWNLDKRTLDGLLARVSAAELRGCARVLNWYLRLKGRL